MAEPDPQKALDNKHATIGCVVVAIAGMLILAVCSIVMVRGEETDQRKRSEKQEEETRRHQQEQATRETKLSAIQFTDDEITRQDEYFIMCIEGQRYKGKIGLEQAKHLWSQWDTRIEHYAWVDVRLLFMDLCQQWGYPLSGQPHSKKGRGLI